MRHQHASVLLSSGESIKDVQARLGHSRPSTTLNHYTHLIPNSNKKLTERMANLIEPVEIKETEQ